MRIGGTVGAHGQGPPHEPPLHPLWHEFLARRGIVPNQIMVVDFREAIALMVHHGLGVSIVPVGDPPLSRLYGLREVPLGRPPMMRRIGLAFGEDSVRQPLIDTLLRVLVLSVEKTALLGARPA